ANEVDVLEVEQHINEAVKEAIDKNQREYYLREQLKAISNELGEGDASDELYAYKDRILALGLAKETEQKLVGEVERLLKMPPNSHEGAVIRSYLDACLELPWSKSTKDKIDIAKAQKILDKEHYGLEKVKERILEILAVRRLAPDIKGRSSAWRDRRALVKPRLQNRWPKPWGASMCGFRWAACGMNRILGVTGAPISARCPDAL
ncbi:MAG: hypothetical protein ACLSAP_05995, partial [Oscillospiraceae bacterium]